MGDQSQAGATPERVNGARSPRAGEASSGSDSQKEQKTNAVAPTKLENQEEQKGTGPVDTGFGTLADPEAKNDEGLDNDDEDSEEEFTFIGLCPETDEVNVKFGISRNSASMVKHVNIILVGDKTWATFEFKDISGPTLELIVEYLKHHKGKVPAEIAKPIKSNIMSKIGLEDAWDAWFINRIGLYGYTSPGRKYDPKNIDQTQCDTSPEGKNAIFDLILAVNYLDIKSLLHLGCAKIATLIKGKTPEETKKILGEDGKADDKQIKPNNTGKKIKKVLKDNNFGRRRLYQILGLDKLLESSQPDRDL